jgi:NAD(P)-dependent dehydrogenase (short-subunit alcohol dehydrogenase family)
MHPPRRVVLVTGSIRGIGAAISARLAKTGAAVVAAYHDDDVAAKVLRERTDAESIKADVGDPAACAVLVDRVIDDDGCLDLLVNNAGVLVERSSTQTSPYD